MQGQDEAGAMEVEEYWAWSLGIGRAVYMRLDGPASIARGNPKDKVWVCLRALFHATIHKSNEEDDDRLAQFPEKPHTYELTFVLFRKRKVSRS